MTISGTTAAALKKEEMNPYSLCNQCGLPWSTHVEISTRIELSETQRRAGVSMILDAVTCCPPVVWEARCMPLLYCPPVVWTDDATEEES